MFEDTMKQYTRIYSPLRYGLLFYFFMKKEAYVGKEMPSSEPRHAQ